MPLRTLALAGFFVVYSAIIALLALSLTRDIGPVDSLCFDGSRWPLDCINLA